MGKHSRRRQYDPAIPEQNFIAPLPPAFAVPYDPGPAVQIQVLGSKNATVAKVKLSKTRWGGGPPEVQYEFEVAEAAKREQGDVSDPRTGEVLALARAFQRLSRELFTEGNRRVKASSEAQAQADRAAILRREAVRRPVRRRTKEEWDAMQQQKAREKGQTFYYPPEPSVKYDPNDAIASALYRARSLGGEVQREDVKDILERWVPDRLEGRSLRERVQDAKDELDRFLKVLPAG